MYSVYIVLCPVHCMVFWPIAPLWMSGITGYLTGPWRPRPRQGWQLQQEPAGDTGLWAGSTGLWTAAVMIAAFMVRIMLAAAAGFPFFLFRMVGAGDIKFMAVMAGCFGLERGFWSIAIGLCLGAVLALGRMLRDGGICRRFLYLTAYIRRLIQSKEIEAYYCPERDGYQCVIPLGACFFAGMLITVLWKG